MNENQEKWPRDYAFEIAGLESRSKRTAALDTVPAEWLELVKTHVKTVFDRRACGDIVKKKNIMRAKNDSNDRKHKSGSMG